MDKDHMIDYMSYVDWHYKGPKSDEKVMSIQDACRREDYEFEKSIRAKADKTQAPVEKEEEEQLDSSYLLL
jgi:hypothetical protein